MKLSLFSSTLVGLSVAAALPQFPPPPGGFDNVKYPAGTGENLPYYPPPPGGWESVAYPPGTGSSPPKSVRPLPPSPPTGAHASFGLLHGLVTLPLTWDQIFTFTSEYYVKALGSEVLNGTTPLPGPSDAVGWFYFGINAPEDTICWVPSPPPSPSPLLTTSNPSSTFPPPAPPARH